MTKGLAGSTNSDTQRGRRAWCKIAKIGGGAWCSDSRHPPDIDIRGGHLIKKTSIGKKNLWGSGHPHQGMNPVHAPKPRSWPWT